MADIVVSKLAYCKMLLHAAKYPHCSINGVLLTEKTKSKDSKCLKFVDAVPLFHLALGLAPMMKVALTQVDAYCQSKNLMIAGYYQANEYFTDSNPNAIALRVMDKIQSNFSEACLLMLDNQQMNDDGDKKEAYRIFQCKDEKWKPLANSSNTLETGGSELTFCMLEDKKFRTLIDFDNHLDDLRLDWKNRDINDMVEHST